jgi:hypothetical protein
MVFLLLFLFILSLLYFTLWTDVLSYFEKIYNYLVFLLPIIFSFILPKDFKTKRIIFWLIFLSYLFIICTTFVGLLQYPLASRELASGLNAEYYSSLNIAGYGFIYSLPFLTFTINNNKKFSPFIRSFTSILVLSLLFLAEYTFSIVLFFLSLFLTSSPKIKRLLLVFSFYLFIFLVLHFQAIFSLLYFFETALRRFSVESTADKVNEFIVFLSTNELGPALNSRLNVYFRSFTGFQISPFFGLIFTQAYKAGGHSEILDFLAALGYFGLIVLMLTLSTFHKAFKFKFRFLSSKIMLFFLALFNPISSFPQISLMIFLFPLLIYEKN